MKKKHALSQSRDPDNEYEYTLEEEEAWIELEKRMKELQRMNPEKLNEWLNERVSK